MSNFWVIFSSDLQAVCMSKQFASNISDSKFLSNMSIQQMDNVHTQQKVIPRTARAIPHSQKSCLLALPTQLNSSKCPDVSHPVDYLCIQVRQWYKFFSYTYIDFPCIPNQTVEICSVYLKVTPAFLLFPIHFYAYPSFVSALKKFLREFYCKLVFSGIYF